MKVYVYQLLIALPFLSLGLWVIAIRRLVLGRPVLPVEPRRDVPWGIVDLLFLMTATISVQLLLNYVWGITDKSDPNSITGEDRIRVLAAGALSRGVAVPLSALLILVRPSTRLSDLGISFRDMFSDIKLGLAAFAMLAPIVYGIKFVLSLWFKTQHPIIQWMVDDQSQRLFWMGALSAVIVAPLAEEYFFRLLFQGWLEKLAVGRAETVELFLGRFTPASAKSPRLPPDNDAGDPQNPYRTSSASGKAKRDLLNAPPRSEELPWWPLVFSASVFAGMHVGHGPDPIPLFVLALALGLLYRNTHRIVPCLVVHLSLNSVSMLMLVAEMHGVQVTP